VARLTVLPRGVMRCGTNDGVQEGVEDRMNSLAALGIPVLLAKWMLIIVGFLAGMFFVGVQLLQKYGYESTVNWD
jgi:hypothetical protein